MGILSSIFNGVATIGSLGLGIGSLKQSYDANKHANEIAERNLEYQKQFNQQVFDRQDTSYQRAVADAVQAGFSPLVASGTSAGTAGGVVSAPQRQSTADVAMSSANNQMALASNMLALSRQRAEIANIEAQTQKTQAETDNIGFTQRLQSAQFDFLTVSISASLTPCPPSNSSNCVSGKALCNLFTSCILAPGDTKVSRLPAVTNRRLGLLEGVKSN